jgi:hypothetical protein
MKWKLRTLYQFTLTVSVLKSAKLTCDEPKHSSFESLPIDQIVTCRVLDLKLCLGTESGKLSPKAGFSKLAMALVQKDQLLEYREGNREALIHLSKRRHSLLQYV